jgi:hypothetical protein
MAACYLATGLAFGLASLAKFSALILPANNFLHPNGLYCQR